MPLYQAIASNGPVLPSLHTMPLADGDAGTVQTLAAIRQLVDQGVKDPAVNRAAIAIIQAAGVKQFDLAGEVRAVYEWVRRNIRFTRDIAGKETLRSAREILTVHAGDCDDINGILLPSLLGTIGHRVRLVTISSHAEAPDLFSHIYAEVSLNGRWLPLDAARRNPALGKAPERFYRKRVWSLNDSEYQDVAGLGYYAPTMGAVRLPRSHRPAMRRRRSPLGDWSDFVDSLPSLVTSATTGAANIIRAGTLPTYPGLVTTPYGTTYSTSLLPTTTSIGGLDSSTLLLLGGGLLLVMMIGRH